MIIRGTPKDINNYYMADNETAFRIEQAGVKPQYIDYDAIYFRITNKLKKVLSKLNLSLN